ncbi:TPA: ATP-grasp domain-containing protein [Candidatus Bathyarchaeota archaeon]|nr:ATP-grasp domain-containing protein [Candidatus Bathyarchaeota archaeon]
MRAAEIRNLLVIGVDLIPLVKSAKKAGYNVYCVDFFGDYDLNLIADGVYVVAKPGKDHSLPRLSSEFDPEKFLEGAREVSTRKRIDAILLSSGFDDSPRILEDLSKISEILGNDPETFRKVRNKEFFFRNVENLGLKIPESCVVKEMDEALQAGEKIGYPVIIKPVDGFGGFGVKLVRDSGQMIHFMKDILPGSEMVIQRYVPGIPASVSVISNGREATALTVNEQLIGLKRFGQKKRFGFSGNIVPLEAAECVIEKCKEVAEKVVAFFGLKGSNGVDIVISEDCEPWIIEVNPRFQSTLECVETVLGINLVDTHINSCLTGNLPEEIDHPSCFCTRIILYAPFRSSIPDLRCYSHLRDIPYPGAIIEEGEPLCSIIWSGSNRDSSFLGAEKAADKIIRLLKPAI